jgi:hypothetical protein
MPLVAPQGRLAKMRRARFDLSDRRARMMGFPLSVHDICRLFHCSTLTQVRRLPTPTPPSPRWRHPLVAKRQGCRPVREPADFGDIDAILQHRCEPRLARPVRKPRRPPRPAACLGRCTDGCVTRVGISVGRWLQLLPQRRAKAIRALKRVCIPAGAGASRLAILCRAFAYAGRALKRSATSPSGDVFVGSTGLTMRAERPSPPARNDTTRAHVSQRRRLAANAPPLRSCTATVPIASAAKATLPKGSLVAALRHRPRRSTAASGPPSLADDGHRSSPSWQLQSIGSFGCSPQRGTGFQTPAIVRSSHLMGGPPLAQACAKVKT